MKNKKARTFSYFSFLFFYNIPWLGSSLAMLKACLGMIWINIPIVIMSLWEKQKKLSQAVLFDQNSPFPHGYFNHLLLAFIPKPYWLQSTAVQIIQIWKWKQNIWWKPCHTWIQISPEQKVVETSCKKC